MSRNRPPTDDRQVGPTVLDGETTVARLDRPRAPESTRIAVVSDPHVATEETGTWKVFDRTERNLQRAVAAVADRNVDGVVVPGDLTKDGEPRNFDRYDELVTPFDVPAVTLPGNHDVPKTFDDHEVPSLAAFVDRYADGEKYPVRAEVGSVDVIGLNTAARWDGGLEDTWGGRVSDRQLAALDAALADAATPVVALHHNLYALPDNPGGDWTNFPLNDGDALHAVLHDHDVPLVVSGHQHVPALGVRDGVREVTAPAVCSYPYALLVLEIGPAGTTVSMVPLAAAAETVESYRAAVDGVPMGRGIARRTERRLDSLPLESGRIEE